MDRLTNICVFFTIYSGIGMLNNHFNTPPSTLASKKSIQDYLGQHISLIHSVVAVIISLSIYIYEGGVYYSMPTNNYHAIAISVYSI